MARIKFIVFKYIKIFNFRLFYFFMARFREKTATREQLSRVEKRASLPPPLQDQNFPYIGTINRLQYRDQIPSVFDYSPEIKGRDTSRYQTFKGKIGGIEVKIISQKNRPPKANNHYICTESEKVFKKVEKIILDRINKSEKEV